MACGEPPEGRASWTLKLLADQLVECEIVGTISRAAEKLCCLPRAENCPTINAVLSRVLNELFELAYHMPNAAETVEAPYTAAERLTFLPQPVSTETVRQALKKKKTN